MTYNLIQYLLTELPAITFVAEGFKPDDPKDVVMVQTSGGEPDHWYDRTDHRMQVLSRGETSILAKSNIESVYEKLKNRFGLLLPQVTVGGTLHEAVQTYQISPIQSPGFIGVDDQGLSMWSFNATITTT